MSYPIHAACQCGQVNYILREPPKKVLACHCTECQKLSTSPFSVTAMVPAETIEISGEMNQWSRIAESGNTNNAKFCSNCGTRIYHFNPDTPELVKLKLKPVNLPDDSDFAPSAHIWVREKVGWYEIPEGMPTFERQP